MKKLFLLFAFLTMAGCATSPIATKEARLISGGQILNREYLEQKPGTGEVVIKRDDGYAGSACASKVYVDAVLVALLWRAEKIVLYLPEGDHMFAAEASGICEGSLTEIQGTVKAEKRSAYRIGYSSGGDYFIQATAF